MSVVSVKNYKDRIEIAADSIVVSGGDMKEEGIKLLKIDDDFIIGHSGKARTANTMFYYSQSHRPERNDIMAMLDYYVSFKRWVVDNIDEDFDIGNNSFLFVYKKKVYHITTRFEYEEIEENKYFSIGYGRDIANTALYLGHGVEEAIKVACDTSIYCMLPVVKYVVYKNKEEK